MFKQYWFYQALSDEPWRRDRLNFLRIKWYQHARSVLFLGFAVGGLAGILDAQFFFRHTNHADLAAVAAGFFLFVDVLFTRLCIEGLKSTDRYLEYVSEHEHYPSLGQVLAESSRYRLAVVLTSLSHRDKERHFTTAAVVMCQFLNHRPPRRLNRLQDWLRLVPFLRIYWHNEGNRIRHDSKSLDRSEVADQVEDHGYENESLGFAMTQAWIAQLKRSEILRARVNLLLAEPEQVNVLAAMLNVMQDEVQMQRLFTTDNELIRAVKALVQRLWKLAEEERDKAAKAEQDAFEVEAAKRRSSEAAAERVADQKIKSYLHAFRSIEPLSDQQATHKAYPDNFSQKEEI